MLKIGMCVGCVKLLIHQTPPRSKGRRSRSQGRMKQCTKHQIYAVNVIGQWKYARLIGNRGYWSECRGQIFDRKQNSRYSISAHVTKEIAKSLGKCILCKMIEELVPYYIGNRRRRSEWQGKIFDRKLLNSRFRACAVKICQKKLIMLSNRHNVSAFIRNRGR